MTDYPRIQASALSLDSLIAHTDDPSCGALAVFVGTVRNHHEGQAVLRLAYSAYAPVAEPMIRAIETEVMAQYGVPMCRAIHRTGMLEIGESAIIAVARGAHRAETFAALRALVEAVKHRVPIWKEEFLADGSTRFVAGCALAGPDAAPAASRLSCAPVPVFVK